MQVSSSFAMLHESQQSFKDELGKLVPGGVPDVPSSQEASMKQPRGGGAGGDRRAQFGAAGRQGSRGGGRRGPD